MISDEGISCGLPMSMDNLAWGRPAALIRHCGGAKRNKFLPGSLLKRTSRVRTMKRIWIGAKLQAWGYNCGHDGGKANRSTPDLHLGGRRESTFDSLLHALWRSDKPPGRLLRRLWATAAESNPASARSTTTVSSTPESATDAWLGSAGLGRNVSVLPFHSSPGGKEGLSGLDTSEAARS